MSHLEVMNHRGIWCNEDAPRDNCFMMSDIILLSLTLRLLNEILDMEKCLQYFSCKMRGVHHNGLY